MPNHNLLKNVCLEKLLSVVQLVMMLQTDLTVSIYAIFNIYEPITIIRDQSVHMSYFQTIHKYMISYDSELPKQYGFIISKYFLKLYFVDIFILINTYYFEVSHSHTFCKFLQLAMLVSYSHLLDVYKFCS
jgi:hypothetical protein